MLYLALLILQAQAQTIIEDFSEPNPLSRWSFSNGSEFPGATGSLNLSTTPWGTNCGRLVYNFEKGGHYVAGLHTLPQSVSLAWISMVVRSPACLHPALRVVPMYTWCSVCVRVWSCVWVGVSVSVWA